MVSVSVTISGADTAVPNTKDSVMIVASVASAHPTQTVKVAYATLTETSLVLVSATPTGVMKTVASMPDNVIQNVRADVSDQPTQTARNVSVIPTEMKTTSVNVTQTGLDQTVSNIWDGVMTPVSDVMDHHTMKITLRMLVSVKSVSITHIVMRTETVNVMPTGAQPLTVISTADHAGRTAPNQLEIATHVDAMDQLSTTVTNVSSTPTAQSMDTVLVTRTGATQILEMHAAPTPANVTTDVSMDVTDQLTQTVRLALPMLQAPHVSVTNIGMENTVNTTAANVPPSVTDVLDQLQVTVLVVYQMPSVTPTETVSVSQASGP
jgi:hypothetical protein